MVSSTGEGAVDISEGSEEYGFFHYGVPNVTVDGDILFASSSPKFADRPFVLEKIAPDGNCWSFPVLEDIDGVYSCADCMRLKRVASLSYELPKFYVSRGVFILNPEYPSQGLHFCRNNVRVQRYSTVMSRKRLAMVKDGAIPPDLSYESKKYPGIVYTFTPKFRYGSSQLFGEMITYYCRGCLLARGCFGDGTTFSPPAEALVKNGLFFTDPDCYEEGNAHFCVSEEEKLLAREGKLCKSDFPSASFYKSLEEESSFDTPVVPSSYKPPVRASFYKWLAKTQIDGPKKPLFSAADVPCLRVLKSTCDGSETVRDLLIKQRRGVTKSDSTSGTAGALRVFPHSGKLIAKQPETVAAVEDIEGHGPLVEVKTDDGNVELAYDSVEYPGSVITMRFLRKDVNGVEYYVCSRCAALKDAVAKFRQNNTPVPTFFVRNGRCMPDPDHPSDAHFCDYNYHVLFKNNCGDHDFINIDNSGAQEGDTPSDSPLELSSATEGSPGDRLSPEESTQPGTVFNRLVKDDADGASASLLNRNSIEDNLMLQQTDHQVTDSITAELAEEGHQESESSSSLFDRLLKEEGQKDIGNSFIVTSADENKSLGEPGQQMVCSDQTYDSSSVSFLRNDEQTSVVAEQTAEDSRSQKGEDYDEAESRGEHHSKETILNTDEGTPADLSYQADFHENAALNREKDNTDSLFGPILFNGRKLSRLLDHILDPKRRKLLLDTWSCRNKPFLRIRELVWAEIAELMNQDFPGYAYNGTCLQRWFVYLIKKATRRSLLGIESGNTSYDTTSVNVVTEEKILTVFQQKVIPYIQHPENEFEPNGQGRSVSAEELAQNNERISVIAKRTVAQSRGHNAFPNEAPAMSESSVGVFGCLPMDEVEVSIGNLLRTGSDEEHSLLQQTHQKSADQWQTLASASEGSLQNEEQTSPVLEQNVHESPEMNGSSEKAQTELGSSTDMFGRLPKKESEWNVESSLTGNSFVERPFVQHLDHSVADSKKALTFSSGNPECNNKGTDGEAVIGSHKESELSTEGWQEPQPCCSVFDRLPKEESGESSGTQLTETVAGEPVQRKRPYIPETNREMSCSSEEPNPSDDPSEKGPIAKKKRRCRGGTRPILTGVKLSRLIEHILAPDLTRRTLLVDSYMEKSQFLKALRKHEWTKITDLMHEEFPDFSYNADQLELFFESCLNEILRREHEAKYSWCSMSESEKVLKIMQEKLAPFVKRTSHPVKVKGRNLHPSSEGTSPSPDVSQKETDMSLTLPATEVQAVRFFQRHGILPSRKKCKCGREFFLSFIRGKCPQWRNKSDYCRTSTLGLRIGTFFCGFKISLLIAAKFINAWCQELTSAKWCRKELQMTGRHVRHWEGYLREVCAHNISSKSIAKIGGPGKIVEVDESLYIRRRKKEGFPPEQWVFGGICKETKECFIAEVAHRNGSTLLSSIRDHIADGSTVYSDCWRKYNIEELEEAYMNVKVNHKFNFVDPESGDQSEYIGKIWGSENWRTRKIIDPKTFHSGFIEFMWRHSNHESDIFGEILGAIREFWPPE